VDRTVILAGSLREANAYARDKGIRATFAANAAIIKSASKLIELPGFAQRRDRFALAQAADNRQRFDRRPVVVVKELDWAPPAPVVYQPELDPDEPQRVRHHLVDDANSAVLALARHAGKTPEELVAEVGVDFEAVRAIPADPELPLDETDLREVGATDEEVDLLTATLNDEQADAVEQAQPKPTRKRAAKKTAAAPVVDAPVEF
jgi:hypothetical protein